MADNTASKKMDTAIASPEVAFRRAEKALFAHYGVDFEEQFLDLKEPALRARVLVGGSGPPMLLVHGGLGVAATWAPLMAELGGFRLYAVDRSGCGLTDAWDHRSDDLRRHATGFVRSVLDALGLDDVPVVANSMGALWSLWLALEDPGRISRLALLGCPALIAGTSAPIPMRVMSVPGLNSLIFKRMPAGTEGARQSVGMLGHATTLGRLPGEYFDLGLAASLMPGYRVHFLSLIERALTILGPRREYVFGDDLIGRVEQPVLLLWGRSDPFGSLDAARKMAGRLPSGRLEIVGTGHLPWLDDAAACGSLVGEFLRSG